MAKITDIEKAKSLLRMGVGGVFLLNMLFVLGLAEIFSGWAQETGKSDPYKKFICFLIVFSLLVVPFIFLVASHIEKRLKLRMTDIQKNGSTKNKQDESGVGA